MTTQPSSATPVQTGESLTAVRLTGNREMAEDLERDTCPTCARSFAPSVLCRHAPVCASQAAKAQARQHTRSQQQQQQQQQKAVGDDQQQQTGMNAGPMEDASLNKMRSAAGVATQITPTAARIHLQNMRPAVSAAVDLARARGRMPSGPGNPSRMPGEPSLFVGSGAHASSLTILKQLNISAVLNCAPSVCKDPVGLYKKHSISYAAVDAQDDRTFALLNECLKPASAFISDNHAKGRSVLIHCMAGVNRSATLAMAHLLLRDRRDLWSLAEECFAQRPSMLQNPSFQLQLCALAARNGLLPDPATAGSGTITQNKHRGDSGT